VPYVIVLLMVETPSWYRRAVVGVLLGALLEALITVKWGRNGSGGRAIGSIGQSNDLGAYLALFSVMAFALLAIPRATRTWWLALGTALLTAYGTVLSLSRGSLVALAAGLVVVAWRTWRPSVLLLVFVVAVTPLWAPDYLMERIKGSTVQVEGSDTETVDMATEARLETWRSILAVVKQHPLDGIGFGGLSYVLPDVGAQLGLEEVKDSAHNSFLRMLSELGVLGLIAFVAVLVQAWRVSDRAVRRARDAFERAVAVGACGATVCLAVSSAFGDRFFSVIITSSFWMLIALVESRLGTEEPGRVVAEGAR
jgi:O-antigen ligase